MATLLTSGAYRISRNPMYTGLAIAYLNATPLTPAQPYLNYEKRVRRLAAPSRAAQHERCPAPNSKPRSRSTGPPITSH